MKLMNAKRRRWGVFLTVMLFCLCPLRVWAAPDSVPANGQPPLEEYRLGPGDILNITVWGFEEFNLPASNVQGGTSGYYIRPDGKFSFPLVGEVKAADLTSAELTAQLTRALGDYLVEPKVTINIAKLRTIRVYVLGEVRNPGMFNIERTHTLLDAVGAAGGPTKEAAKKNIYVVRRDQPGKATRLNLLKILEKGDMRENISLGDGDAIYLTSNGRLEFSRDIAPIISSIYMVTQWGK